MEETPQTPIQNSPPTTPTPIPPQPTVNTEKPKFLTKKRIIIFLTIFFVILILSSLFYFFRSQNNQALKPAPNLDDIISNAGNTSRPVPEVQIANYEFQTVNPQVPVEIPSYSLKSDFIKTEVDTIAATFNLSNGVQEENEITYANTSPEEAATFNFNTTTGSFTYQAYTPTQPVSTNPQTAARTLLTKLGFTDTLIDCGITYKRAETPDVTYVECHRSWDRMGLPLVSLPGFYNTPEEIQLSQMTPGIIDSVEAPDPSIIQVSTGQNGLTRPTDFNTATIGVMKNGSIVSVASNLRYIENASTIQESELKTPEAAKSEFGNALYSVVLPAGEGVIDLNKVFPENKGTAQSATVTGYNLVYLEKLRGEKQITYEPFYLIRGETTLENGFTAKLVQAVPALINSRVSEEDGLQLGTFTPAPTQIPELPEEEVEEIAQSPICTPSGISDAIRSDLNYVTYSLSIPGYGNMEFHSQRGMSHTLILGSSDSGKNSAEVKGAIDKLFENSYVSAYTTINKGNPLILPLGSMSAYYKANPAGSTTSIGIYAARGIPDPRGIVGSSRQNMLLNFEQKALASDRGETVSADGPGFSLQSNTATNKTNTDNVIDFEQFFIIDATSMKSNPCYITGSSPSIFARGNGDYKITPPDVTYAEPLLNNASWSIHAEDGSLLVNGKQRNFLYYEFDSKNVVLNSVNQGYSFKTGNLSNVISKISSEMGLTNLEEKQLFNEVQNELSKKSKFITLKIVSQEELDKKLPLSISPTPSRVVRLHFIIEEGNEKVNVEEPKLPRVDGGNVILELGASKIK